MVSGGKDGGAVFEGDADYAGAEVGGEKELVRDGRRQEVAGGHVTSGGGAADGMGGGVAYAVNRFSRGLVDPVVAGDAVDGGDGAGEDGGVADGGIGGEVVDVGVFTGEAFGEEAAESAGGVAGGVAVEVVPAHLVDDDADDEAGTGWLLCGFACGGVLCGWGGLRVFGLLGVGGVLRDLRGGG